MNKLLIINGTNRIGNRTSQISGEACEVATKLGLQAEYISLDNFDLLFRGEHWGLESSPDRVKIDLQLLAEVKHILFVVPIYHHSLPGALKNFLDIVDEDLFADKVIGFISAHKTRNDGALAAKKAIDAILAHKKHRSFTLPRIEIIDLGQIDQERIKGYIEYMFTF